MTHENNFIDALEWRYATKVFDSSKKVNDSDVDELLEAVRLSPSSFGLQPWKIVSVNDEEKRKKLREVAWNQAQITDASHLFVLCARTDLDENYVDNYIKNVSKERSIPVEKLKDYRDMMVGFVKSQDKNGLVEWAKKQVYIALGVLLSACALKKIDSCPMEGFDNSKFDEILELEKENLTSAVICPVGYRSSEDKTSDFKKVRFRKEDLVLEK